MSPRDRDASHAIPSSTIEVQRSGLAAEHSPERPLQMSLHESAREYLIRVDVRSMDQDPMWFTYDDGFLTIGCDGLQDKAAAGGHESQASLGRCCGFLLSDPVESAALRTECTDGALLIHVPKSTAPAF